jgi:four helix bundle protein
LKEADETDYWLDLLHATDYIDDDLYDSLAKDCSEIIKILTSIIKTLKDQ